MQGTATSPPSTVHLDDDSARRQPLDGLRRWHRGPSAGRTLEHQQGDPTDGAMSESRARGRTTGRGCWRRRAALRREARPTSLPSSSSRTEAPRSPRRVYTSPASRSRCGPTPSPSARSTSPRASSSLVVLAPVILIVAALVRLDSYGPAFFRAPRVGFGGRELLMLKFRKMHHRRAGIALTHVRRRAPHPHRRLPRQLQARRAAPALARAPRRHEPRRPAPRDRRVRQPPPRGVRRDPLRAARRVRLLADRLREPRAASSTRTIR